MLSSLFHRKKSDGSNESDSNKKGKEVRVINLLHFCTNEGLLIASDYRVKYVKVKDLKVTLDIRTFIVHGNLPTNIVSVNSQILGDIVSIITCHEKGIEFSTYNKVEDFKVNNLARID